jgi:hypothetical protein
LKKWKGSKKDFFTKIDQIEESDFEVGDHTRTKRRQPKIEKELESFWKGKKIESTFGEQIELIFVR